MAQPIRKGSGASKCESFGMVFCFFRSMPQCIQSAIEGWIDGEDFEKLAAVVAEI